MVTCKNCGILMINTFSFSKDKNEKFSRCPKCHSETKHQKLKNDDLDFHEVLHKTIQSHK